MKFIEWIGRYWKPKKEGEINLLMEYMGEAQNKAYLKTLAINACINLIARSIARCEFICIEEGIEKRAENYYKFNVEPNPSQSAGRFWQEVISNLIMKSRCLVIQYDGSYYIADSYTVDNTLLGNRIYRDIFVKDSVTDRSTRINRSFQEKDVFFFELYDMSTQKALNGLYDDYIDLMRSIQKVVMAMGNKKLILNIPTAYPQTEQAKMDLETLFEKSFKNFFDHKRDAVLPLTNDLKVDNPDNKGAGDGKGLISSFDEMAQSIFKYTAIAFGVPLKLLLGEVEDTENSVNNLITFCINPISELIADEINRKLYRKRDYLDKSYIKLDTTRLKHIDITKVANALDILTRIGAYSINDSLRLLGKEEIAEAWANKRYITKNYEEAKRSVNDEN